MPGWSAPGEKVLVIGGGNVAIDVGRVAKRLGATEVTLAFLESLEDMPAHQEERAEAEAEGLQLLPSREFLRFDGRNGRARGVQCRRINSFEFDADGNPVVDPVEGSEHILEADTIVVAIGQRSDLGFLPDEAQKQWKALSQGQALQIGGQWVISAGDVASGPSKVVDAIVGGKHAAASLDSIFRKADLPKNGRVATAGFDLLNMAYFMPVQRQQPMSRPADSRVGEFDEVVQAFSNDALLSEAARCFHCGDCNFCSNCWIFCPEASIEIAPNSLGPNGLPRYQVDYGSCKGCGICVQECPRAAIAMEEEVR